MRSNILNNIIICIRLYFSFYILLMIYWTYCQFIPISTNKHSPPILIQFDHLNNQDPVQTIITQTQMQSFHQKAQQNLSTIRHNKYFTILIHQIGLVLQFGYLIIAFVRERQKYQAFWAEILSKNLSIYMMESKIEEELEKFRKNYQKLGELKLHQISIKKGFFSTLQINDEVLQIIHQNPKPFLTALILTQNLLSTRGIKLFTKFRWEKLLKLSLKRCKINDEGVKELANADLPMLLWLDLSFNQIGNEGAKDIGKGEWPYLRTLDLTSNKIGCEGLEGISHGKWPKLNKLRIGNYRNGRNNFSGNINLDWIFEFPSLKLINITDCNLSEENASKIYKLGTPNLEQLYITSNPISGNKLFNKNQNVGWSKLKTLKVSSSQSLSAKLQGFTNILNYHLPQLKILTINSFFMGKQALRQMKQTKWVWLQRLEMSENQIDVESIKILAKHSWKSLKFLNLSKNPISDSGFEYLKCANWPKLSIVVCGQTNFSCFGILNLCSKSLPKLRFVIVDVRQKVGNPKVAKSLLTIESQ